MICRTAMNNAILVTVFQSRADLAGKFPCDSLAESAVAYYIVEHLPAIDELENDVMIVGLGDDLARPAYIRMK
jgi:hypothetical protein